MMAAYRALPSVALLAAGIAGGYAFLKPYEHAPVPRIVFEDVTGPAPSFYLAQSPSLNFQTKTLSAENEKSSGKLTPALQIAAAMPSDAQGVALDLQKELTRAGCYAGIAHGNWDQRSKNAMKEFLDRVNARLPVEKPDPSLLALTRHTPGLVCAGDRRPPVAELAANAPSTTEWVWLPPSDPERAPGAMGLGGPIMVPVGTILEGEESARAQTVTVVGPATVPQQAANAPVSVRSRSSSRANPQYENRDPSDTHSGSELGRSRATTAPDPLRGEVIIACGDRNAFNVPQSTFVPPPAPRA